MHVSLFLWGQLLEVYCVPLVVCFSDSLRFLADFVKERFFTCGCDHIMTAGLVVKEPSTGMCNGSVVRGGEGGVMSHQLRQCGP